MKEKIKSNKESKRDSLNNTSSTFFEPSFSKITFRKRGNENSEDLSDIGEEEDIQHSCVEIVTVKSQTAVSEFPQKKKKKKKSINESLSIGEPDISGIVRDENKSVMELDSEFESLQPNHLPKSSINANPPGHKKKEKKKNTSEDVIKISPNEKPFQYKSYGGDPSEVNVLNFSENIPKKKRKHPSCNLNSSETEQNSHSVLDFPKKKRERNSEHRSKKLSKGENCIESDEIEGLLSEHSENHKLEHINSKDHRVPEIIKNSPATKKNRKSVKLLEHVETCLNSTDEENHLQKRHNSKEICDTINSPKSKKIKSISVDHSRFVTLNDSTRLDTEKIEQFNSPLLEKKKKKPKKLLDVSNLSIFDLLEKERLGGDNNEDEIVSLSISAVEHLAKNHKELCSNSITEALSISNNNNHVEIKGSDHECSLAKNRKNKKSNEMEATEPRIMPFGRKSTDANLIDVLKMEANVKQKEMKEQKNSSEESVFIKGLESLPQELNKIDCEGKKKLKLKKGHKVKAALNTQCDSSAISLAIMNPSSLTESRDSKYTCEKLSKKEIHNNVQESMSLPKKKKKINKNVELSRNQLLKQACATEKSADFTLKSRKQTLGNNNVDALRKCLLNNAWTSKQLVDFPPKSSKHKPVEKQNIETEENNSHKELVTSKICTINKSEKSQKNYVENLDSLRERLLKEAISTVPEEFSLSKLETGEKINAGTLRKQLLKDAISEVKTGKHFLTEKVKQKELRHIHVNTEADKSIKVKYNSKKLCKNKEKKKKTRKLKKKSNDIDFQTDILISKALEKVASSSTSHSSQENIYLPKGKVKGIGPNNQRNKVAEVETKCINLEQNVTRNQDQELRKKKKIDKLKKALLNSALGNINPGFKCPKKKSKKKTAIDK